jgi:hypothetical protein
MAGSHFSRKGAAPVSSTVPVHVHFKGLKTIWAALEIQIVLALVSSLKTLCTIVVVCVLPVELDFFSL